MDVCMEMVDLDLGSCLRWERKLGEVVVCWVY